MSGYVHATCFPCHVLHFSLLISILISHSLYFISKTPFGLYAYAGRNGKIPSSLLLASFFSVIPGKFMDQKTHFSNGKS